MDDWVKRVVEWLRTPPEIPDSALVPPHIDSALAERMARESEAAVVANNDLDYSVESLVRLQQLLPLARRDRQALYSLGAYLGEVIRRNASVTAWVYPAGRRGRVQRQPRLAVGRWLADPLDYVQLIAYGKAHPDTSLSKYVQQLWALAENPTYDTATALGLRRRHVSAPKDIGYRWRSHRREHRREAYETPSRPGQDRRRWDPGRT